MDDSLRQAQECYSTAFDACLRHQPPMTSVVGRHARARPHRTAPRQSRYLSLSPPSFSSQKPCVPDSGRWPNSVGGGIPCSAHSCRMRQWQSVRGTGSLISFGDSLPATHTRTHISTRARMRGHSPDICRTRFVAGIKVLIAVVGRSRKRVLQKLKSRRRNFKRSDQLPLGILGNSLWAQSPPPLRCSV